MKKRINERAGGNKYVLQKGKVPVALFAHNTGLSCQDQNLTLVSYPQQNIPTSALASSYKVSKMRNLLKIV